MHVYIGLKNYLDCRLKENNLLLENFNLALREF